MFPKQEKKNTKRKLFLQSKSNQFLIAHDLYTKIHADQTNQ